MIIKLPKVNGLLPMKILIRCLLLIFLFMISIAVSDAAEQYSRFGLPDNANYPGGIAIVKLPAKPNAVAAYYDNHRVLIRNDYAIIGIPLKTKITPQVLTLKSNEGKIKTIKFIIIHHTYPLRHITIADKSKVTPNPALAKIIAEQQKQAELLLTAYTLTNNVPTHFILPAKGWFSSFFGLRRIYNNVHQGRHTGLDIAANTGAPIVAAANGIVSAVADRVLTGNTVYINHGEGLFTIYCHMSKVDVKAGQSVKQGQLIGEVGATGRVTGAHLHWEVVLNGAKVNPMLFLNSQPAAS